MNITTNRGLLRVLIRRATSSTVLLSALLAGFVTAVPTTSLAANIQACTSAELNSAISNARAGDEIVLCNKTWRDVQIVFKANGTASAPVTLRAATPGQVKMAGSSTLKMSGTYAVVDGLVFNGTYTGADDRVIEFKDSTTDCNRCRLTNTAIIGYNPAANSTLVYWVAVYGQYNRIDHNYFSAKTGEGAMLQVLHGSAPDYHKIDHNYFGDRPNNTLDMGNALQIGTTGKTAEYPSLSIIEYNYFFESDGDGELISNKSSENIYRYNTFVGCRGQLALRQGNNTLVDSNFFFGGGKESSGGIKVRGEGHKITNNYMDGVNPTTSSERGGITLPNGEAEADPGDTWIHYPTIKNVTIAFNTIVNSGNSLFLGKQAPDQTVPPENITIANNIVYSTRAPLIRQEGVLKNLTYSGNILYGASLGITKPSGTSIVDPKLAIDSVGLHRPMANSPAVDSAASGISNILRDIDGHGRQTPFDVGADERSLETIMNKPLTRCDVGPVTFDPTGAHTCSTLLEPPMAPTGLQLITL